MTARGRRSGRLTGVVGWLAAGVAGPAIAASCSVSKAPIETGTGDPVTSVTHPDAAAEASAPLPVEDAGRDAPSDAAACRSGETTCGATCANLSVDPKNCGQCGTACDPGALCAGGTCTCAVDGGQTRCNDKCVTLATDPSNCGACGHSCQGSTCTEGLCQPTVVAQATGTPIWGMVVDSTSVYRTQLASAPMTFGAASRKAFAGMGSTTATVSSTTDGIIDDPHGIAVDLYNMYWVDYANGAVEELSLMGQSPIDLLRGPMTADGGPSDDPIDIASDGQSVFWVTYGGGQVLEEPIGGGAITALSSGEDHPHAVAVDVNNVYWVDFGDANPLVASGSIVQAPKAGPPGTRQLLAGQELQAWDLAVDDTSVYWTDRANPGSVKKVPIGGGAVTVLAQGLGAPYGIAVDADYVYWTNFDDNTVQRLPKAGGAAPFTLAAGQNNPASIAVDTTGNVWWVNQGAGTIVKVAR